MVSIGNLLAAHASLFGYSEDPVLRAEIFNLTYDELVARLDAGEPITGDCSSTYEAVRKDAGCINLPPLGYTGTELQTMPHIALADGLPGDAIVFGPGTGLHVVWIASAHPTNPTVHSGPIDPKIDSHGEPGFQQTDLQTMWDTAFPGQPITVLSLAPFLPPVPTPPVPPEEDIIAIAAAATKDGKVHVFQETSDGTVYGCTQEKQGGPYDKPFIVMKNGQQVTK